MIVNYNWTEQSANQKIYQGAIWKCYEKKKLNNVFVLESLTASLNPSSVLSENVL